MFGVCLAFSWQSHTEGGQKLSYLQYTYTEKCQHYIQISLPINQCSKSGSIPNRWGWLDSPQPSSNLVYAITPLWSAKYIFSSQTYIHTFILNLLFPRPPQSSFLPLTFNLKNKCPSQDITILSPLHMTIANWSMVSFKPNMNMKSLHFLLSVSCTPHIALTMDLSVLRKIPISLSFKRHASLRYSIAGLVSFP